MPSASRTGAATTGSGLATTTAAGGHAPLAVGITDACEPNSFNEAFGAGTCERDGGIAYTAFVALLRDHRSVGAWHFVPPQEPLDVGDVLRAVNHGGETHTFTEVVQYGGGIVPMLNELSGVTTVVPECQALQPDDFIPAGGSSSETAEAAGVARYQCCIHPWMRAEVRVGKP